MPVTFTIDMPDVSGDQLAQVNQVIADRYPGGIPEGLLCHLETPLPEGGTRVIDIWESDQHFQRFYDATLGTALAAAGVNVSGIPLMTKVTTMFGELARPEDPREIASMFYDAITRNDPEVLNMFTEDYVDHEEIPGIAPTREGVRQWLDMMHGAFSDLHLTPLDVVLHGDTAAVRARLTGTHAGEFMGIPPTGRKVDVQVYDYVRLTPDRRCSEHWGLMDTATLMTQLGIPGQQPSIELPREQHV